MTTDETVMGELRVAARAGGHAIVAESGLEAFRGRLRGPLLLAGDAGYDEARTVFNALIDHRPALIARCAALPTSSPRSSSRACTTFWYR
jgi:hypothetical protein